MMKIVSVLFLFAMIAGCGGGTDLEKFCKKASDKDTCESPEYSEKCEWDTVYFKDGVCRPK